MPGGQQREAKPAQFIIFNTAHRVHTLTIMAKKTQCTQISLHITRRGHEMPALGTVNTVWIDWPLSAHTTGKPPRQPTLTAREYTAP